MDPKDQYTMMFLRAANQPCSLADVKKVKTLWWWSTRDKDQGGLRLTDLGLNFVQKHADVKTYKIELPKDLVFSAQIFVWLDQFIDSPFHLTKRAITVLSEKSAFELYLFSGDVKKMGASKALAKRISQEQPSD